MEWTSADATLSFDPTGAVLRSIELIGSPRPLLRSEEPLFDLALPLPQELPHRLSVTMSQAPTSIAMGLLQYVSLQSTRGEFPVACTLRVRPEPSGGFALQLTVENRSKFTIPQVVFPRLIGLLPTGPVEQETLHLGRSVKWPYPSMVVPDKAASFLDLHRRAYFVYGMQEWNLKWWRLGNHERGLSVYSRDLDVSLQGLYLEKAANGKSLTLAWAQYPHIAPGATWVSPEFVLMPHRGDWRVGAEPYKAHASKALPTVKSTKYLRESLGVRSLFFSTYLYDDEPNYRYRDLPRVAKDALDHGVRELNVWFAFDNYFELPFKLNARLGTVDDLKAALAECRRLGVNVAAFVSCRALKARTAPPDWFEVDERGNRRTQHYSYSLDFVPPFNPPYCNRDESAFVCPAAAGYREAMLNTCRELHALGFSSISYDQLFADRLCYGPHGHQPQSVLAPLYDLVRQVYAEGKSVDADASLSGEFFNDVSQTFQHYNWDWITGTSPLYEQEPFRYVFPRFRLGLLVDRGRRWLLEGFCRGMLVNFLPDNGEGLIGDDAAFSDLTKRLAAARKTYARFFEEGDYFGTEGVPHADGLISSLYRHDSQWLLILANVSDKGAHAAPHRALVSTAPAPATHFPPYSFTVFLWRDGAEQWVTV